MSGTPLSPILTAKLSGGDVTPGDIVIATGEMTAAQKAQTLSNLGAADASTSIPDDVKVALINCFNHVAWVDDQGQSYVDALTAALYPLDHITAVYTQSETVYDTDSLDSLKADLVVTAVYEGGNTETVAAANYTLSGTLTAGTSTITVSYGGKTATFTVTVTHRILPVEYQQTDFVASDGTAYFSVASGFPLGTSYKVKAFQTVRDSSVTRQVLGASNSSFWFCIFGYSMNANRVGSYVGTSNCFVTLENLYTEPTELTTVFTDSEISVRAKNATEDVTNTTAKTLTAPETLKVFWGGQSTASAFVGRIYDVEIRNTSNEIVAKFYPCYRISDSVAGLYDTVSSTFYPSDTATPFTWGNDT